MVRLGPGTYKMSYDLLLVCGFKALMVLQVSVKLTVNSQINPSVQRGISRLRIFHLHTAQFCP